MFKKIVFLLLMLFLSACQVSKNNDQILFDQPLTDGQLAYGYINPNYKLFIENAERRVGEKTGNFEILTQNGHFVVGIPQDATDLKLTLQTEKGNKGYTFPIRKRKWKEDVVNGLPPQKVIPPQEEQKRILEEILMMRKKRKNSNYSTFVNKWMVPISEYSRISSPFGARRVLNGTLTQGHSGTDYAAS